MPGRALTTCWPAWCAAAGGPPCSARSCSPPLAWPRTPRSPPSPRELPGLPRSWKGGATEVAEVKDDGPGHLFHIHRRRPSLALEGRAELLYADIHHITLGDVVPENGKVLLSLHYQEGMRASPGRVQVERAMD